MQKAILIIDFGSQYTQLIARKIRELNVFCVIFTYKKVTLDLINELNPSGIILSGGPNSVLDKNSPKLPLHILSSNIPILGICYGLQALTLEKGGKINKSNSLPSPSEIKSILYQVLYKSIKFLTHP